MAKTGEPLVARNGFDIFRDKVAEATGRGKPLTNMSAEMWLRCAQNSAAFQDFEAAVEFGKKGLDLDRLHKETRMFLSQNSPIYEETFSKEKRAVGFLSKQWLERCFTSGYRRKVKNKMVADLEESFESNVYDMEVRSSLAYYAKDKWRAKFLFESVCAAKIQNAFKEAQFRWAWQEPIRMKYVEYATSAYIAFMKNPLDRAVRDEVNRVIKHKFCSKKHAIRKLVPILEKQAKSIKCLVKSYRAFSVRLHLAKNARSRKVRRDMQFLFAVLKVQKFVRKANRLKAQNARKALQERQRIAHMKINAFIGRRSMAYQTSTRRVVRMEKKLWDEMVFIYLYFYMFICLCVYLFIGLLIHLFFNKYFSSRHQYPFLPLPFPPFLFPKTTYTCIVVIRQRCFKYYSNIK
jgi:hypothetical protein